MTVTIEPFEWASALSAADQADAARIADAAAARWVPGERPGGVAGLVDDDRLTAPPERVVRRLARDALGAVVAHGYLEWRDGPGACMLRLFVDPARWGEGIGRSLGSALVDDAREAGRSGVTVQAVPGDRADEICRAAGLREDMVVEQNRAEAHRVDPDLLERWRAVGEAAEGYELVTFDAPVADDLLAASYVEALHVMNDAPRFEGEPAHTYSLEELRAVEDAMVAARVACWHVGVRHRASGQLVGLTDLYLGAARPWMAYQGDTAVEPAHRGHGLGGWMKAVNHLRLRAARPEVELVQTWNAASNEPMLRINRALGFQTVQRYRAWFLPLE